MSDQENMAAETPHNPSRGVWSVVWEIIRLSLIAFIIVVPFRIYVAQPFIVSGTSMVPTFSEHDYLIIDRLSYRLGEPERGDVVIFQYPLDPSTYFVKRIIGLPGEEVRVAEGKVSVRASGTEEFTVLNEPYLETGFMKNFADTVTLSNTEYYVMGDNRDMSSDSRVWGPLQRKFIVGRAFVRLLPIQEMEILPGEHRYENIPID